MGAIVDILLIDEAEHLVIQRKFPTCTFIKVRTGHLSCSSKYRVIVPDHDEEEYYQFLVERRIALCSSNFIGRVTTDPVFTKRMSRLLSEHRLELHQDSDRRMVSCQTERFTGER